MGDLRVGSLGAEGAQRSLVLLINPNSGRRGEMARALREVGGFEVREAASPEEAARTNSAPQPDVVLLDVTISCDGVSVIVPTMLREAPAAKIVIMATGQGEELGLEALRAGAVGFLGKDLDQAALVRTVNGVAAGEAAISRRFATWLVDHAREEPERRMGMRPVKSDLTAREWEVLDLLSAGISKPAIARDLSVTLGTVRSHLRNLARKLSIDAPELGDSPRPDHRGAATAD